MPETIQYSLRSCEAEVIVPSQALASAELLMGLARDGDRTGIVSNSYGRNQGLVTELIDYAGLSQEDPRRLASKDKIVLNVAEQVATENHPDFGGLEADIVRVQRLIPGH